MVDFLHTFHPDPVLLFLGPISIHWYGLGYIIGILGGFFITRWLLKKYKIETNFLGELGFWLVLGGLIGARLWYVIFIQPAWYFFHPLDIFKIWQGGMAAHGAIAAGLIVLWIWSQKHLAPAEISLPRGKFWFLASVFAPALAFGQIVGRFGNYFNQELYGLPTNLPWGIPIDLINRVAGFENFDFFHPTFLYESIGSFFILLTLLFWHKFNFTRLGLVKVELGQKSINYDKIALGYLILYSFLRLGLGFIRIDPTLVFFGMRVNQWVSLVIIVVCTGYLVLSKIRNPNIGI